MDIQEMIVTIEKFLDAWEKYFPTKMEIFYFKHFSRSAENNKLSWIIFFILFAPFLMGWVGTALNASHSFIGIVTYTFGGLLTTFAIPWFYVLIIHNRRIKKIVKYLGCTMKEYEKSSDKWAHLIK